MECKNTNANAVRSINSLMFTYGNDQQRIRTTARERGSRSLYVTTKTTTFVNNLYEEEKIGDTTFKLNYVKTTSLTIIHKQKSLPFGEVGGAYYYIHTDRLGSYDVITDENGTVKERLSYDAWGNRRNPNNWAQAEAAGTSHIFTRGFTEHEHLDKFRIINMNGRLYDPVIGRFFSPDSYVQAPTSSQGFNRYSYCMNNPLMGVDPSGEWALWDDVIVGGVGFVVGYVTSGITTGDWGWKSIGAGTLSAGMFLAGYYTAGGATASYGSIASAYSATGLQGYANTVAVSYAAQATVASVASAFMPSFNIPINSNFSLSVSPGFGIGPNGLIAGVNFSGTYTDENLSFTAGYGVSNKGYTASGGLTLCTNVGDFSYYMTYFGGRKDNQNVGGIAYRNGDFSLRVENDLFVRSGDRYRTSAVEIGYQNFIIGTQIYTNEPDKNKINKAYDSRVWGSNVKGAYAEGQVWRSPLYLGYRNGGNITRIGIDAPIVQDLTQNVIHRYFSGSPYFYTPYGEYLRPYMYTGAYNHFTLY